MRPSARIRCGYYPAPPESIALLLNKLELQRTGDETTIFDCCAGEGRALAQLADGLNIPPANRYAVELAANRADECRVTLGEGAHVLGPASFIGTSIRTNCFSLAFVNPPFDDEYGGGRVEETFLSYATSNLVTGGVMVFVCPEHVSQRAGCRDLWMQWYESVSIIPFPAEHRRFNEVFMVGVRRKEWVLPKDRAWSKTFRPFPPSKYMLPSSNGPGKWWRKTSLVDDEIVAALEKSPLQRMFEPPPEPPLPRPPLALGTGHIALLLASGYLDGVVRPENESPHIVRGSCSKVEEVSDVQVNETKGSETTKTTITERIVMSVRTLDQTGKLRTLA